MPPVDNSLPYNTKLIIILHRLHHYCDRNVKTMANQIWVTFRLVLTFLLVTEMYGVGY
jgi:hypothetical protein